MDASRMRQAGFMYLQFTNGNVFYLNIDSIVAIEVYKKDDSDKERARVYLSNGKVLSDIVGSDFSIQFFEKQFKECVAGRARSNATLNCIKNKTSQSYTKLELDDDETQLTSDESLAFWK